MATALLQPNLADRRIPKGDDFLDPAEVASLTSGMLTQRIRDLQPLIAAHAADAEAMRRPHDDVWAALRKSGFFYQFVPKDYGGMENSFDGYIDAGMAIAEVCPSTAWCACFCAEHNWIFSFFPQEALKEVWGGEFPYIIAPMTAMPPGVSTPVEGGYRVNAQWRWGTGVMHADWVMGQTLVLEEGKPPAPLVVMVPAEQAEVIDTWHSGGMAGTGSNDVALRDVFVPTRFTVNLPRSGARLGHRKFDNPIYGVPMLPFLGMCAAIPAAGAVRGMVNTFAKKIANFARPGSNAVLASKPQAHIRLARADAIAKSAEVLIRDVGRKLLTVADLEDPDRTNTRLALRAQLALALQQCREAAMILVEGAGTSIHASSDPFHRAMRDIIVVSTHVVYDPDIAFEQHGRGLVGLEPNTPLS